MKFVAYTLEPLIDTVLAYMIQNFEQSILFIDDRVIWERDI
jgi:hypothetical protein